MECETVVVERENTATNKLVNSSGLLFDGKYVLLTSNLFPDLMQELYQEFFEAGTNIMDKFFFQPFKGNKIRLNIISTDDQGLYVFRQAKILCAFVSENIRKSNKYIFKNWAIDARDNYIEVLDALSLFFVLTLDVHCNPSDLKNSLEKWWNSVKHVNLHKCDSIYIKSVPFGNRQFINSYSQGIVSNIFGNNCCMILSDCPSTAGSESSPVYVVKATGNCKYPIGIVISSATWWCGEWVGCTLIADIRSILTELTDIPLRLTNFKKVLLHHNIIGNSEFSLVQVYSRNNWGTAILLCKEKGIFITNSHVVDSGDVVIFYKGKKFKTDVVYKTPQNAVFDLAVIRCKKIVADEEQMTSISFTKKRFKIGDPVYSASFPIFSKECQLSPTISKGNISQVNKFMLRTTCSLHPGSSGGAIMNESGGLIGVIVCNVKFGQNNAVFPKMNMAIPFSAIENIIFTYLTDGKSSVLKQLHTPNRDAQMIWKQLESKL